MNLPRWLQDRIGTPTRNRGAKPARCIVCQADVLAGPNEDTAATPAICDPEALTPLGEALALISGRHTYRLGKYDNGLALWIRTKWNIEANPASQTVIVLTDHRCNSPLQLPTIEIEPILQQTNEPVGSPPF